jgi:hypothetical protein
LIDEIRATTAITVRDPESLQTAWKAPAVLAAKSGYSSTADLRTQKRSSAGCRRSPKERSLSFADPNELVAFLECLSSLEDPRD